MKIWRYNLPNVNKQGWAIVVMCEDGYFSSVSDYGDYAYKWQKENGDFREFIMQIADRNKSGYFLNKIAKKEYDGEETCKAVQRYILESRRDGNFTKEDARTEWENLRDCDWVENDPIFTRFYDRTKIDDVCELIRRSYPIEAVMFVQNTLPRLAEMIRQELENEKEIREMDIKAELRLIREKCPIAWDIITDINKEGFCPSVFSEELNDSCISKYQCGNCGYCWDKAVESEDKAE